MRITKEKSRNLIIIGVTVLILSLRPAMFGQALNEAVLLLPLIALVIFFLLFGHGIVVSQHRLLLFGLLLIFSGYLVLNTFLLNPQGIRDVLQSTIVFVLVGAISLFCFSREDAKIILKTITYIFILLSFSQLITYSYMFLTRNPNSIYLGDFISPNAAQPWPVKLYFPFTLTAGFEWLGNTLYPRATGIYREPGIYQAFLIFTYFSVDYLEIRIKSFVKIILLFALFTVFSTAGYVIFFTTLFYTQIFRIKKKRTFIFAFLTIILVAFGMIYMWDAGLMGIQYKLYNQGARLEGVMAVPEALKNNLLFGLGLGNSVGGINFISTLADIGLIGGFLYLLLVIYSFFTYYSPRSFVLLSPILLSLLFAQPLYNKGVTIFLLFFSAKTLFSKPGKTGLHIIN